MTKRGLIIASISLVAGFLSSVLSARAQDGGPLTVVTPDNRYVSVAQGPGEAQSIGSYALRLYQNRISGDPTGDFVTGVVRPRDGFLWRLDWQDVTGEGREELIVITQSVGTGSYLNADAFRLDATDITLVASVNDLEPNADLVAALKTAAGQPR